MPLIRISATSERESTPVKPVDVFSTLEFMIEQLSPNYHEAQQISDMLDLIKRWEQTLEYYARGNYDRGVLARQAQGLLPPEDQRPLRQMAAQGSRMGRLPTDTEN